MKTAHEWMQIEQTDGHPHILCPSIIRAIQLDAMKEGAARAGDIAEDYDGDSRQRHGNDLMTKQNIASEIRSTFANWTEADL